MTITTTTNPPTTSALTLSLLTSLGGIIGYARTGSIPSIAAGLSVGALYLLSYLRLRQQQQQQASSAAAAAAVAAGYGEEIGLLASSILAASSIPRAFRARGRKPVPVALSVLATYGVVVFGLAVWEKRGLAGGSARA